MLWGVCERNYCERERPRHLSRLEIRFFVNASAQLQRQLSFFWCVNTPLSSYSATWARSCKTSPQNPQPLAQPRCRSRQHPIVFYKDVSTLFSACDARKQAISGASTTDSKDGGAASGGSCALGAAAGRLQCSSLPNDLGVHDQGLQSCAIGRLWPTQRPRAGRVSVCCLRAPCTTLVFHSLHAHHFLLLIHSKTLLTVKKNGGAVAKICPGVVHKIKVSRQPSCSLCNCFQGALGTLGAAEQRPPVQQHRQLAQAGTQQRESPGCD